MTRLELLTILVGQARQNGFEFRHWFTTRLELPWTTSAEAIALLDTERRYYALLFSHDFARSFWKAGAPLTVQMKPHTFQRVGRDGTILEVERKAYQRRSTRNDVWRYHLGEMAGAAEPLRYIRRFLHIEDEEIDGKAGKPKTVAELIIEKKTLALARKAHARRLEVLALERELAAAEKARGPEEPNASPSRRKVHLPIAKPGQAAKL